MTYTIYGFILILIGLIGLACHGLEVQWKSLKQLFSVHRYEGWFKVLLTLAVTLYFWIVDGDAVYSVMQFDKYPPLMQGEVFIFRVCLELFLTVLGANIGALLSDICIFIFEWIYHRWSMLFLNMSGQNLNKTEYQRAKGVNTLPPQVVSTSGGSGAKSPSQVAQRAIAEMEAKQKAAKEAKAEGAKAEGKTKKSIADTRNTRKM